MEDIKKKRPGSFNLTGSKGKEYDLDEIQDNSRLNSDKDLIIQIHRFNPNSKNPDLRSPNPKDIKLGQIWLSKEDTSIL